jgi:hypothetical protein
MRILNVGDQYFVCYFRDWDHQVLTIGEGAGSDLRVTTSLDLKGLLEFLEARGFWPELVLWNDTCRPPAVHGLERLPAVNIGFSIDQYCNPWQVPYSAIFDLFLVAQKDWLSHFDLDTLPRPCRWFPLFCNPKRDRGAGLERDIPVSFVGTLKPPMNPERWTFLEAFRKQHDLFLHQGDYHPVFSRSRIVLNQSAVAELNFRIFQGAAHGAAVLTEDVENGLTDLFSPGEDLLTFPRGDADTAAQIARQALARPESLAELARRGQRKVTVEHSALVRARQILAWAEELAREKAQQWRLANQPLMRRELARAFYMLAADLNLPLSDQIRRGFLEMGAGYERAD